MPSIHVIYDPKDAVPPPRAADLQRLKVSHIIMALGADDLTPITIADIANDLAKQLLARVSAK